MFGAAFGAILVNFAKSYFTVAYPEIWLFFLGALFVLVTIFLPRGVVGLLNSIRNRASRDASPPTASGPDIPDQDKAKNSKPAVGSTTPPSERTPVR